MRFLSTNLALGAALLISACGGSGPNNFAKLGGDHGKDTIFVTFQNAPAGTICKVVTPAGTLTADVSTSGLAVPSKYRSSPLTCQKPNGKAQKLNILTTMIPASAKGGSITAQLK
jgi:hypothetical protein